MEELTEKQVAFVIEYLKDFNATQAAIRAGYSKNGADVQGSRLLGNVRVQESLIKFKYEMIKGLQQQFIADALTARRVMFEILNDANASNKDRITVAKDFLDRAGFKPVDRRELSGTNSEAIKIVFVEP
ncbi:terminase small subunit [Bacillus benzoevorans]|uniref:Phage terminase small subunit n=1 Tax=Bacillus benzoevorans TaxID=1456 RepID=A0A7X0HTG4_9BACI|nr:terminase small subunit [Bacillus benzoevorans]MBB6446543.1 phage terminase small subunit [Bacillus benzoevorans]